MGTKGSFGYDKGLMIETRSGIMEAHRNVSSINGTGIKDMEAARITSLEQKLQDLHCIMDRMARKNQELNHKLMERMDHLCFDNRTQEDTCPRPKAEGPRRGRDDDSQGLGASVSRPISAVGEGAIDEQDGCIQRI